MNTGPAPVVLLSALVFALGLLGVFIRRGALEQLMALALLMTAPVVAFAGFSQTEAIPVGDNTGGATAAVVVVVTVAFVAVGVAVIGLLRRRGHELDLESGERLEG